MSAAKVVTMNESGAVMFPKHIMNLLKANKFTGMFGSMKGINLEKFKEQHEEDLR